MSRLVLPAGMYPAPTGDGATAVFPKTAIPAELQPAPTGDGSDSTDVLEALRCMSGAMEWPEATPLQPAQPPAADSFTPTDAPAVPASPEPAPSQAPAARQEPVEPDYVEYINGAARYLHQVEVNGGSVATTADGQPLARVDERGNPILDADGNDELIWVDTEGYEALPPELDPDADTPPGRVRGRLSSLFYLAGSRGQTSTDDTAKVDYYDKHGVPITDFDIVPPGAPPVSNVRNHGKRLVYGAAGMTALFTVSGLVFGIIVGSSRVPAQGAISANEAAAYGLSTFPVDSASSFGARYLQACLTHGDSAQMQQRQDTLAAMAAPNVASQCGWQSGGNQQAVDSVAFNGYLVPVPGYDIGQASYLGYDLVLDGQPLAVSVPVWVGPTEGGGQGMQVVGDLGITPTLPIAQAPMPRQSTNVDQQLGSELTSSVIEPFPTAWAASDTRQMTLLSARNASTNVRNGLEGALTRPKVGTVVARPDKPISQSGDTVYADGDTAIIDVAVNWTLSESSATQDAGYRLYLRREADRWLVTDIQSGLVDVASGRSNTGTSSGGYNSAPNTSAGTAGGSTSGGLGSVDDLQSGDDSSSDETGSTTPSTP